jgi:ATP phosphoribosyltransferase
MAVLKIALPSGSLQESTLNLFANAGYRILANHRSYIPSIDDPDLEGLFLRAQEIAHYVERGVLDVGLTGKDWILENGADVVEVAELPYSKSTAQPARWVIAVPDESPVRTVDDLQGKRIATELVNVTRKYLDARGVQADVEFSWGSTEAKVRTAGTPRESAQRGHGPVYEPGLVDAIVELTETGSSIRANKLRIVESLLETTPRLIANRNAWDDPWKRQKAQNIATLLVGAFQAEDKVGLKMNVRRSDLDAVVGLLPALNNPTISNLLDGDWVAVEVVVDERVVRDTVPLLKNKGAEGIIEYPLNKVIY